MGACGGELARVANAAAMIAVVALLAALPGGLIDALMRQSSAQQCIKTQQNYGDTVYPAREYLGRSLEVSTVKLRTGETIAVVTGTVGCFTAGLSSPVYAFQVEGSAYRVVLDDRAIPAMVKANADGTIELPNNELADTAVYLTYVWNGSRFVFSPQRSTRYQLALSINLPYQTDVHFASGTSSAILSGIYAYEFGPRYAVVVRKGQRITVEVLSHTGTAPAIDVEIGDTWIANAVRSPWTGVAPRDGTYIVEIEGDQKTNDKPYRFQLRLAIH
jgi:hypothetical protein